MRRESSTNVPLLIRDDESDEELYEVSMSGDLAFENAAVSFGAKVLKKEKQGFLPQLAIVEGWEDGLALGCSAWKDSSSNGLAYLRVVALNFKSLYVARFIAFFLSSTNSLVPKRHIPSYSIQCGIFDCRGDCVAIYGRRS